MSKGGKYHGKSHAQGGIKQTIPGTGQQIEVEGDEGLVSGDALNSAECEKNKVFKGTNQGILSQINKVSGDKSMNEKATGTHAGDYVVNKKAMADPTEKTITGDCNSVVREINQKKQSGDSILENGGSVQSDYAYSVLKEIHKLAEIGKKNKGTIPLNSKTKIKIEVQNTNEYYPFVVTLGIDKFQYDIEFKFNDLFVKNKSNIFLSHKIEFNEDNYLFEFYDQVNNFINKSLVRKGQKKYSIYDISSLLEKKMESENLKYSVIYATTGTVYYKVNKYKIRIADHAQVGQGIPKYNEKLLKAVNREQPDFWLDQDFYSESEIKSMIDGIAETVKVEKQSESDVMGEGGTVPGVQTGLKILHGSGEGQTIAGIAEKHGAPVGDVVKAVAKGMRYEAEHGEDPAMRQRVAMNHIWELGLGYYDDKEGLPAMERRLEKKNENKDKMEEVEKIQYYDKGLPAMEDKLKEENKTEKIENMKRETKEQTELKYKSIPKIVKDFMPEMQQKVVNSAIEEFQEVIESLEKVITEMPNTHETDGQGDKAIAHLHYFHGNQDWWITEKDMEDEQMQAFGLVDLGYGSELGYINIEELKELGKSEKFKQSNTVGFVELDFHWTPKTIAEIKGFVNEKLKNNEMVNMEFKPEPENIEVKEKKVMKTDRESAESKQRFSPVKEIDRGLIDTDPHTFQGRQSAYSEESVSKIVSEGFDKTNEPIIVWFDGTKYIVISGHSRWEASKRLYKGGEKSLQTMPVKVFMGDKDEAVHYAVLESNRASTQEGFASDVEAVRRMLLEGYNKADMVKYVKPKSYLDRVINYTYLDPSGRFIEVLNSESRAGFPFIERNAEWVAIARKLHGEKLTNAHEREIFDFMYKTGGKKGLTIKRDELMASVEKRVGAFDWDKSSPLNLASVPSSSPLTTPLKRSIAEIDAQVDDLSRENVKYHNLIARARVEGLPERIPGFDAAITNNNARLNDLVEKRLRLQSEVNKLSNTLVHDLFSSAATAAKSAPSIAALKQAEHSMMVKEADEVADESVSDALARAEECFAGLRSSGAPSLDKSTPIVISGIEYAFAGEGEKGVFLKSEVDDKTLPWNALIMMFNNGALKVAGYDPADPASRNSFALMVSKSERCNALRASAEDTRNAVSGVVSYTVAQLEERDARIRELDAQVEAHSDALNAALSRADEAASESYRLSLQLAEREIDLAAERLAHQSTAKKLKEASSTPAALAARVKALEIASRSATGEDRERAAKRAAAIRVLMKHGGKYARGGSIEATAEPAPLGFSVDEADLPGRYEWRDANRKISVLNAQNYNGHSDWRLPTKEELNQMYLQKDEIGGFVDASYWASTEYEPDNAWVQYFLDGSKEDTSKSDLCRVRLVRASGKAEEGEPAKVAGTGQPAAPKQRGEASEKTPPTAFDKGDAVETYKGREITTYPGKPNRFAVFNNGKPNMDHGKPRAFASVASAKKAVDASEAYVAMMKAKKAKS